MHPALRRINRRFANGEASYDDSMPARSRLALSLAAAALAMVTLPPAGARAGEPVTVPVDVGIGPAAYVITGSVSADQPIYTGLKLSVQAIIDQATLQRHQDRIPARMRQQALRMKEVRFSPSIFIPDALLISPAVKNTGIYGITWRPIALGVPLADGKAARLGLGAGLLITYAYIHSNRAAIPTTHFLRPGIDLAAELELAPGRPVSLSFGWASGFYLPQELGGFGLGAAASGSGIALEDTLWHFGQAFVKLHFRFPYTTRL
jgi:hypothetical protein